MCVYWDQDNSFSEKNWSQKISLDCPFKQYFGAFFMPKMSSFCLFFGIANATKHSWNHVFQNFNQPQIQKSNFFILKLLAKKFKEI
jgi:hypothetical protein